MNYERWDEEFPPLQRGVLAGAASAGARLVVLEVFEQRAADALTHAAEYLPFGESVELMKNRQLDATLQSAGLGVSSIRDLATSVPIVVVEIPTAVVDKVGTPYVKVTIPANTYEGQTEAVRTAAVVNYLVTHSGVKDETVYQMTKAIYESLPDLAAAHAAAVAAVGLRRRDSL